MRSLFRTNSTSFRLLNATQFLGALNDNVFKFLVIYLLIPIKGPAAANTILALAGAIFVLPFLLFSSAAGVLADKISKRSIIVFVKCFELVVILFASIAVAFQSEIGLFTALFFMGTHSAIFAPSKYGIIPELVESKMVPRANGSITSLTYLAIILGTFFVSLLADVTNRNFIIMIGFCCFISVLGVFTSLGITRTIPGKSTKKVNPVFLYEIYQTLKLCWNIPHILVCIFGSTFFLFLGAFVQLNIIPFAMQSLSLSEVGGGWLFLAITIGIAIGALLAGRLCKEKVELGVSCLAAFGIAVLLMCLWVFSFSLIATIIILVLLGVAGGSYLVPFDSYLQLNSPNEKRGQIIAAANFFSFIGALVASIYLYVVNEYLGFSSATSFMILGCLSLLFFYLTAGRLSSLFLSYVARKILPKFKELKPLPVWPENSALVVLESSSWKDAILLYGLHPNLKMLVPGKKFRSFPWINGIIDSIRIIPENPTQENIHKTVKEIIKYNREGLPVCLFVRGKKHKATLSSYKNALDTLQYPVISAEIIQGLEPTRHLAIEFHK